MRRAAVGVAVLATATGCATASGRAPERPRSAQAALRLVLSRTCLPYVADGVSTEAAAAASGLVFDGEPPSFPGVSHETGRRYRSPWSWRGLRSVRLHGEASREAAGQRRSCTFVVSGAREADLEAALEGALLERAPALTVAPDLLPGRRTFSVPGALVVTSGPAETARWGEKEIDVYAPPGGRTP